MKGLGQGKEAPRGFTGNAVHCYDDNGMTEIKITASFKWVDFKLLKSAGGCKVACYSLVILFNAIQEGVCKVLSFETVTSLKR